MSRRQELSFCYDLGWHRLPVSREIFKGARHITEGGGVYQMSHTQADARRYLL